mgnify:CR=1 FL=1
MVGQSEEVVVGVGIAEGPSIIRVTRGHMSMVRIMNHSVGNVDSAS